MVTKVKDAGGEYEPVLTPLEAARRLGINVKTLQRWTFTGLVPCLVLPSGHRRYRLSDIEACLQPFRPPDHGVPSITPDSRPGSSRQGRGTPPGARTAESMATGHGRPPAGPPPAGAHLAAVQSPPGARLAQTAGHQRAPAAGLAAARAPGGQFIPASEGGMT